MKSDDRLWHERATLRQLTIFDAVMVCGSAGAAARRLGLSQPAVTHAMAKLEHGLGVPLLERGQAGSAGTEAGHILHRRVGQLAEQLAAGIAMARGEPDVVSGVRSRVLALTSTQLACHLAIARHGSFRAAAQALSISEPALQRTARDLERMMGVAVYQRRAQHITVTMGGQALATQMQLGLAEIAQAGDEIAMAQGRAHGRIALGCLPLMPKGLLARALGQLLARFPSVEVSLEEGSYNSLCTALRQGRLDMLLGALRGTRREAGLVEQFLFDDPYVVVARRGHPLAHKGRRLTSTDLARQRWVAAPSGTPRRAALDELFMTLPSHPPIVLETNSVAMLVATLMESDCLALSSREQARIDFADMKLARLAVKIRPFDRPVGVTIRSNWLPTRVQQELLQVLRPRGQP